MWKRACVTSTLHQLQLTAMLLLSYVPCPAGGVQVTNAQIGKLARLAAGRPADSSESSNGNGSGSSGPELVMDDFRHTADAAYAAVDVPDTVVDILAELRCYLQVGRCSVCWLTWGCVDQPNSITCVSSAPVCC